MSDVLGAICERKRQHVHAKQMATPAHELEARVNEAPPVRDFFGALSALATQQKSALIAEIKKASPSKGIIRHDFDPTSLARAYADAGAACLSVLTDEPYFQGHDDYLRQARSAVGLPVLRKDFMLEPYQITESRALGADAVLLIMAALTDAEAIALETEAMRFGMTVLAEVHDELETERALKYLKTKLIGVNNRDLKSLKVDLATTERLKALMPQDRLLVCESGINTHADLQRMTAQGIFTFLVGESLMREEDVTYATRRLLGTV